MFSLIWSLLKSYRLSLMVVLLAMVVETAATVATPWPLKVILDNVVGEHKLPHWVDRALQPFFLNGGRIHIAGAAAIAVVVIALLGGIASYVDSYYTTSVGQWVANDLRVRTYHHLQRLSLHYYDVHQIGTMLSTLTDDVDTIQDFASSGTLGILVDVLTIAGMLAVMFWLNWNFTLIGVAVAPFLLLLITRLRRAIKKATREVRRQQSRIMSVAEEGLSSMKVVQAYGRQDLEQEEMSEVSKATVEAALKARRVKALLSPTVSLVVALCTGFVLWRSSVLILTGAMTAGALTVFLYYLVQLFKPVKDLASMTNTIAQTAVGVERVRALLEADDIIPETPGARDPGSFKGEIEFDRVVFEYQKNAPVLQGVSFKIQAGEMIGLVGATGEGKTTVMSLIPRFYDPSGGRVIIDGVDIKDYKLRGLRGQIAYVLQDTVLFHGTLAENIAFGKGGATRDEIEAAAKLANAEEFILKMPMGYDTLVGDRSETLSGGQRQRIGIARAVIRNNPILILDEPTAALDAESEKLVIEALERLMKGRTVITIAHRLSTIRDVQRILVLKDGVVAEEGSHEELMARGGIYADLYQIQFKDAAAAVGNAPVT